MNKAQKAAKACCRFIAGRKFTPNVIIDFGIGLAEEVPFFKHFWPKAKLIGADPICRYDFSMFDVVYPAAVCNKSEDFIEFYEWTNAPCSSGFIPNRRKNRCVKHTVPVIPLDRIFEEQKITGNLLLWIDCEGAELSAMKSGPNTVKHARWIHLEVTPESKKEKYPGIPYQEEVHAYLTEQGYVLRQETGNINARHDRTYEHDNE